MNTEVSANISVSSRRAVKARDASGKGAKSGLSVRYRIMILWRFVLAVFGGYALASLLAMLLSMGFPAQQSSAVMTGTMLAFVVHCGVFIWVFMVQSTLKASLGVLLPTALCFGLYMIVKGG